MDTEKSLLFEEIQALKKEKEAILLAHYYVNDEVQKIADYIGDSYYLSKLASETSAKTIVFCGVAFMGESAKILNPGKLVLLPDLNADCPMAHMTEIEKIKTLRNTYSDLAVVCYINSTAELKMHADVCVTSANAIKIIKSLPNRNIFFIPDEHLGRYAASQIPEKNFIFNDGYCPIHHAISKQQVCEAMEAHPEAEVLVHPECKAEITELADYVGSTSGIIKYASQSSSNEFLVCTETGVFYELQQKNPGKKFYAVNPNQICPDMKLITLEKIRDALKNGTPGVELAQEMRTAALKPLTRMLELSKD